MNREIKFRSAHFNHDGTFSGFTYWGMIDLMGRHSEDSFAGPTTRSGTIRKFEDQFTGLMDKNDKEIYEGDIVQCLHWEPINYQIVFIEGAFCLGDIKTGEWVADVTHMEDSTGKHFEVIGNIHENT